MVHDYHGNGTIDGYDVINSTKVNETASTPDDIMSSTFLRVLFVAMYAVIFLLGVSGNSLVVLIVWRNKSLQTITNIFIVNLAASDVMMCLLAVPFTPISGLLTDWIFGKARTSIWVQLNLSDYFDCWFLLCEQLGRLHHFLFRDTTRQAFDIQRCKELDNLFTNNNNMEFHQRSVFFNQLIQNIGRNQKISHLSHF